MNRKNFNGCDTAYELFSICNDISLGKRFGDAEDHWEKYIEHSKTCKKCRSMGGAYNEILDRVEGKYEL